MSLQCAVFYDVFIALKRNRIGDRYAHNITQHTRRKHNYGQPSGWLFRAGRLNTQQMALSWRRACVY